MKFSLDHVIKTDKPHIHIPVKEKSKKGVVKTFEKLFKRLNKDVRFRDCTDDIVLTKDLEGLNDEQLKEYYDYLTYKIDATFRKYGCEIIIDHHFLDEQPDYIHLIKTKPFHKD